jgi:hypothetical protein
MSSSPIDSAPCETCRGPIELGLGATAESSGGPGGTWRRLTQVDGSPAGSWASGLTRCARCGTVWAMRFDPEGPLLLRRRASSSRLPPPAHGRARSRAAPALRSSGDEGALRFRLLRGGHSKPRLARQQLGVHCQTLHPRRPSPEHSSALGRTPSAWQLGRLLTSRNWASRSLFLLIIPLAFAGPWWKSLAGGTGDLGQPLRV